MQNKIFNLALVVVLAVFLGVTLTVQQTNNPVMRRLVEQQTEILDVQRKIERQLAQEGSAAAPAGNVDQRLASLEKKIDGLAKIFAGARKGSPQRPQEDPNKVYDITIGNSPIKGNKDAPITIVEFTDFQCPFCARFHPVLNDVVKANPDKVKVVLKNFPLSFHPQAKPAAKAAFAAGEQGKYYEMADLILENVRQLGPEKYTELAQNLGLNMDQFKKDLANKDADYEKRIQEDLALGAKVNVRGTPTFYINGKKANARDVNAWQGLINQILSNR